MINKLFRAVRRTLTNLDAEDAVASPRGEEAETQHYATYALSEVFPFRFYTPREGATLEEVAMLLNAPLARLAQLNASREGDSRLLIDEGYCRDAPEFSEPTVEDALARDFERLMGASEPAVFFLSYATVRGDALGRLLITDLEILFEPLNPQLKGFLTPGLDDHFCNRKLGMSVDHRDLVEAVECVQLATKRSMASRAAPDVYIMLSLANTGNYALAEKPTRDLMDALRAAGLPLARVYLKVNDRTLLGRTLSGAEAMQKAQSIRAAIEAKRRSGAALPGLTATLVPFFDIEYRNILQMAQRQEGLAPPQKELQLLHQNIFLLEKIFGFRFGRDRSLARVSNQSLVRIEALFPALKRYGELAGTGNLLAMAESAMPQAVSAALEACEVDSAVLPPNVLRQVGLAAL